MLNIFLGAYWLLGWVTWLLAWVFCFVLRNVYSDFFLCFLPGQFVFLLLSCKSSLYILNASSLSDIWFANVFSYSMGCLFTVLMLLIMVQKYFLIFISFNISVFFFYCLYICCLINYGLIEYQQFFTPIFSSKSFTSYTLGLF